MSTRSVLLALALVSVPSVAAAQATDAPPPHPHQGWFGGFGLHAGEIACEGEVCEGVSEAGGVNGTIGWGFGPKLGINFDVWAMAHTEDNLTLHQTIATVNARYWLMPILWIQGGVGGASAGWRYKGPFGAQLEDRTENVPAIALGAGLEVLKGKSFSLDIQLRFGMGFYDEDDDMDGSADQTGRSSSLGVGFTWY
jgi:hypothetical protein